MYNRRMKELRYIASGAGTAARNMASDEVLALSLAEQRDFSYLRIYSWKPAALSFGYNQKIEKIVNINLVQSSGISLVRRMTGGRMVFHDNEYTFSAGMTIEDLKSKAGNQATFLDMFIFMISPLVVALQTKGIAARLSSAKECSRPGNDHHHCYSAAAGHSIFAGNKKLVGAAGLMRDNCLVIHGSIPIKSSMPPEALFNQPAHNWDNLEIACLSEFLSNTEIKSLPDSIAQEYSRKYSISIRPGFFSEKENLLVEKLANEKYADLFWKNGAIKPEL